MVVELRARGLIEPAAPRLTAAGRDAAAKLMNARREEIRAIVEDWKPDEQPEVEKLVERFAASLAQRRPWPSRMRDDAEAPLGAVAAGLRRGRRRGRPLRSASPTRASSCTAARTRSCCSISSPTRRGTRSSCRSGTRGTSSASLPRRLSDPPACRRYGDRAAERVLAGRAEPRVEPGPRRGRGHRRPRASAHRPEMVRRHELHAGARRRQGDSRGTRRDGRAAAAPLRRRMKSVRRPGKPGLLSGASR